MSRTVNVVGYEETRELSRTYAIDGTITNMTPIEGSERTFLNLELPGGHVIRAEVSPTAFEEHVWPLLTGGA